MVDITEEDIRQIKGEQAANSIRDAREQIQEHSRAYAKLIRSDDMLTACQRFSTVEELLNYVASVIEG